MLFITAFVQRIEKYGNIIQNLHFSVYTLTSDVQECYRYVVIAPFPLPLFSTYHLHCGWKPRCDSSAEEDQFRMAKYQLWATASGERREIASRSRNHPCLLLACHYCLLKIKHLTKTYTLLFFAFCSF